MNAGRHRPNNTTTDATSTAYTTATVFKYSTSLRSDDLGRILTGTFQTINEAAS